MSRVACLLVVLALLASACSSSFSASESSGGFVSGDGSITVVDPADREGFAEISGETLDGQQLSTDDLDAQVLVLNVWGSWCVECRIESADLQEVWSRMRDRGVRFLGIDIRDQLTQARRFEEEQGITYPSIFDPDSSTLLQMPASLYPVATPTTYLIDGEDRVAVRILGPTTASTLAGLVEDLLAEQDAT